MQAKKEISFILIFMMVAALLTGCSDITNITINGDGSVSYSEVVTVSKELWDMSMEDSDDTEILELYKTLFPGADVSLTDTVINDTASKELHLSMDFKNTSDFCQAMNRSGMVSTKYNKNYYSRSALYSPVHNDQAGALIPDNIEDLLGDDAQLMDALVSEMQNMNIKMTITFPYTVLQTNGTLQEDGKTVVWELQQLEDGQAKEQYYATFTEQKSAKKPTFSGAKNEKFYNTGITLNVNSENLLEQVNVNGQTSKSDCLLLTDEGNYKVTALDINGNKSTIKFYIDMTKPAVKGVKNGNTYKKNRTVKFSDKGSGIKKATLNNKKINSGKKIAKKGNYTLSVVDKAGNKKTVKFKIK